MNNLALSPAETRDALTALDQALYSHEQWCEALQTSLICQLTPDERDIDAEAHRKCRFGQWYYARGVPLLGSHPGFGELEFEHRRMHEFASKLLQTNTRGERISVQDYERFLSAVKRLRLEILTLKQEFEDTLYNLDPLTGASSRIGMLTKLREQQELVKRKVQACCIAMMDLDLFKSINDVYGHQAGDRVLAATAQATMKHLRPYDKVFRYGGEEFLICMPDATLETGHEIVERLRAELAAVEHEGDGKGPFKVTVSFGVTLIAPDVSVEEAIDRADKALYAAKARGRNQTVVWDAAMT